MTHVVAVVGPTAVGKSDYAVELALRLGGEILSCDSMQVYRGMDIGTAKPTAAEMRGVPHHLIDLAEPEEPFSVSDYVMAARAVVADVTARGKIPIFCGGTGLYLDRFLCGGLSAPDVPENPALREELFAFAASHGNAALHNLLRDLDPVSADAIHPNNVKRVVRAIEICRASGTPKSELDRASRSSEPLCDADVIGLSLPRDELYDRIDRRVDRMMEAGLAEEVARLDSRGVFEKNHTAAQAIGYKELLPFVRGSASLSSAVNSLKLATRHYAKRQLTWFKAKSYVKWI